MELSYALTWMIGTSCLFGLIISISQLRLRMRGWFYVNAAILIVLGFGVLAQWNEVGYLGSLLWGIFVVLPGTAQRRVQAAIQRQKLAHAARWAWVAGTLHPFDGQAEQARMMASHSHFDSGHVDAAKGVLYSLLKSKHWAERAKMELLRLDSRWSQIAAHAKNQAVGTRDLQLAPLYLRAFGEIGDHESMWTMYGQIPPSLANEPALRLQMACYSGQLDHVELMLARHFSQLPRDYTDLARATALYVEGRKPEAESLLIRMVHAATPAAAHASRRLAQPPPIASASDLSPSARSIQANFEHAIRAEVPYARLLGNPRRPWMTIALLMTMLGMFLWGLPGGSTNLDNLVGLGALVLPSRIAPGGVAWRIVAAGFLHFGATHLVMNCLGLWVLGREIEQLWNGRVMLAIFLCASIGSFAFAAAFVEASPAEPRHFLGASAGVFGLVGALGTFLTTGYFLLRRKALGRRILLVLAVVAAQFVFDWFTPIVSSMLHLTGLLLGALAAIPFSVATWRRRLGPSRASG